MEPQFIARGVPTVSQSRARVRGAPCWLKDKGKYQLGPARKGREPVTWPVPTLPGESTTVSGCDEWCHSDNS